MREIKMLSKIGCCIALLLFIQCSKGTNHPSTPVATQPKDTPTVAGCKQCIVLTDQAEPAIDIIDIGRQDKIIWSWSPYQSNIDPKDQDWFSNPDEAKPVYDLKYLLINASGGGVALIRIADKKAIFYTHAGKNPHSSEVLPDGNIVTASSTDNRLVIFHVDTTQSPDDVYKKVIPLPFAHNVVWDRKRNVLWAAGENNLYEFQYNFNCELPDLIPKDTFQLPGNEAHDLFPVYGKDSLFFTNPEAAYYIDLKTMNIFLTKFKYLENIKSVSAGLPGWPTIIMIPKTSWWSDEVMDTQGDHVFEQQGMKIYKARWFLPNLFSYPENNQIRFCNK